MTGAAPSGGAVPTTVAPAVGERTGRAALTITAWNLVSRLSGFARVLATTAALGIAVLGDTYHRANQVSNVLFELLAGGMLFSVLIPTFVERFHHGDRRQARDLASALATRGAVVLGAVVAIGIVAGPWLMELLTSGAAAESRDAQVALGTFLLWFVLPQLVLYGIGSVASALLQADRRFVATSVAPTCNNLVVTATMIAFAVVHDPADGLALSTGEKVLLGGGTLAGTLAMTAVPFWALRRAGLGIGPRWRVPDVGLRELAGRGLWGAGHVGLNQVLILTTVVLAGRVDGGVIAYQTAFTFFLLPHALLAHPIFTALFPRLSRRGAAGEGVEFARDLGLGLRAMLLLLLPAAGALAVVAAPALSIVRFGLLDERGTRLVALVLAAYLLGLAGYSAFFLLTRAAYALGDARSPTMVNLWSTAATVGAMVVAAALTEGTALLVSFGVAHAVAITAACFWLHRGVARRAGAPVAVAPSLWRAAAAAAVGTGAAGGVAAVVGWETTGRALVAVAAALAVAGAVYLAVLALLRTPELDLARTRVAGALGGRR